MSKKAAATAPAKEKVKQTSKEKSNLNSTKKVAPAKQPKNTPEKKAAPTAPVKNGNKPGLRSVYSNSKYTLLPLGFATDFKTKKQVVIFSDLSTGQVHTVALAVWNRWKLKEVKKINTET